MVLRSGFKGQPRNQVRGGVMLMRVLTTTDVRVCVLTDASDLHAGPSQRSEGRLSSGTRSLCPETNTFDQ